MNPTNIFYGNILRQFQNILHYLLSELTKETLDDYIVYKNIQYDLIVTAILYEYI